MQSKWVKMKEMFVRLIVSEYKSKHQVDCVVKFHITRKRTQFTHYQQKQRTHFPQEQCCTLQSPPLTVAAKQVEPDLVNIYRMTEKQEAL